MPKKKEHLQINYKLSRNRSQEDSGEGHDRPSITLSTVKVSFFSMPSLERTKFHLRTLCTRVFKASVKCAEVFAARFRHAQHSHRSLVSHCCLTFARFQTSSVIKESM